MLVATRRVVDECRRGRVPIDDRVVVWRRAAERAGNRAVAVIRLPGTAHAPVIGGREEIAAVSPLYERALVDWLARVTRSG
ncbi:MAG TPA: hypothetical protein VFC31_07395 [Candidatus Limnocylindria bacterium]|nr:hypothetical protein [Candidatus Limnocylindria bacterium]